MTVLGSPWWIEDQQIGIDAPSPTLGQHNTVVYKQLLGLSEADIAQLTEQGVM